MLKNLNDLTEEMKYRYEITSHLTIFKIPCKLAYEDFSFHAVFSSLLLFSCISGLL